MLYLTCTSISSVDLAQYGESLAKNWVSVECGTRTISVPVRVQQGVVRWCWVNFQCRGVLLIWIRVGQWSTTLPVGAGGGCLDIISLVCHFCSFSLSLGDGPI